MEAGQDYLRYLLRVVGLSPATELDSLCGKKAFAYRGWESSTGASQELWIGELSATL
ncbi:hypothetical protein ACF0H5_011459 [Mactra antiquata]